MTSSPGSKGAQHNAPKGMSISKQDRKPDLVVAGSIALDLNCNFDARAAGQSGRQLQLYTSNPVKIHENIGGVGRNIATAAHELGLRARLCTLVGDDALGSLIIEKVQAHGMLTSGIRQQNRDLPTARYIAVNEGKKSLHLAAADMRIFSDSDVSTSAEDMQAWIGGNPRWTVIDANWSSRAIRRWFEAAKAAGTRIAFEPVSVAKARRLFDTLVADSNERLSRLPLEAIHLVTPNALELQSLWGAARDSGQFEREDWFSVIDGFGLTDAGSRAALERLAHSDFVDQGLPQQSIQLLPFIPCIAVTLGSRGVLLTQLLRPDDERLRSPAVAPFLLPSPMHTISGGIYMRLFPSKIVAPEDTVNVNGVGDTFLGALVAGLTRSEKVYVEDMVNFAQECAVLSLKSGEAVSPDLAMMKSKLDQLLHSLH